MQAFCKTNMLSEKQAQKKAKSSINNLLYLGYLKYEPTCTLVDPKEILNIGLPLSVGLYASLINLFRKDE